jgi:hypothetical protein
MFFVVDKSRLQRMIDIVREDRAGDITGQNAPFLRLEASESELTVSSSRASETLPATVYEEGVLFIRTTKFSRVLKITRAKEQYVTFQFTEEGLRFCDVLLPFDAESMVYFPDVSGAPENWPLAG